MGKRSKAYMIFLCVMVFLALVGIVLLVSGSANHVPQRRLFPSPGMVAQGLPL